MGCYWYTGSSMLPSLAFIVSLPRSPALSHSLQGGGLSPTTHNAAPMSKSSHCSTVCNGGFCWEEWGIRPQHHGDNGVPMVFHGVPVPLPAWVWCLRVQVGVWQKIPEDYPCHPLTCTLMIQSTFVIYLHMAHLIQDNQSNLWTDIRSEEHTSELSHRLLSRMPSSA